MGEETGHRVCGRTLSEADLAAIRVEIALADPPNRAEIARRVCRRLDWRNAKGEAKLMSARVGLLRLHRSGLIDRYHYLGYSPLPGAQLRYLIESEQGLLGALGFGAAAWKVAARDRWIGWERETRERHLGRVLNNARFLVLPWIRVRNLASRVLALAARQVGEDFAERYGERPVLLETFVETLRFRGTCYRAANWQYLGCTQGRGKCDVAHRAALARKDIYVYPLSADFRRALGVEG
ncbi:hypothetical protein CKO31_24385 [Thiohalocapsa halophila]|uniref:DUF4338 domain-containing protein n=1 Tax=Thiohalocapsa halophila TaxID=69359 RepID=A0ABS1CPG2_9GAMM|nr:Druantia anti-phage system protein DruA [Thiohalocapsa halophila]MBK1633816.1 hypothetical protein [Thiohalocapsa halophila]